MHYEIVEWLLQGDVSLQYLTHVLLLKSNYEVLDSLQRRIEHEGYGAKLLSCRSDSGHWGLWYYQPKWTCTHYTLYELKHLGIRRDVAACRQMVLKAFDECMLETGGMNFAKSKIPSDVAIDGMFLDYACYFCPEDNRIGQLLSHLINQEKPTGGYSWDYKATMGDPHTTICVLEGLVSYLDSGLTDEEHVVKKAISRSIQFIMRQNIFMDYDKRFFKLTYPYRYRFDLLRFLECATRLQIQSDKHICYAIEWLKKKRNGLYWELEYIHPGAVHLHYEQLHYPSRFITLKALYILNHFG